MKDNIMIATMYNDTVRIYVAYTTQLVTDAHKLHQTFPTSIAALGRSLTATSIMGAMLKDDQSVAVKIDGGGPIGKIITESDANGNVVGYCQNPGVYLKYDSGKLNVSMGVGTEGFLTVTTDLKLKEPYTSTTPLIDGEIAMDYTYYFTTSMQTPSSVSLGVLVSEDNQLLLSGGFIVQVMPDCKDETITHLEKVLADIKPFTTLMTEEYTQEGIIGLFSDDYKILDNKEVRFQCGCSKKRFKKGIRNLGIETIEDFLNNEKNIVCKCQYCSTEYEITEKELRAMVMVRKGDI